MKTVVDQLRRMSEEIKATARSLLRDHSALECDPDASVVPTLSGNNNWKPLDTEGRQLQSRVLGQYDKLIALLRTLLRSQPPSISETLAEESGTVYDMLNQECLTWIETTDEAKTKFDEAIDRQIDLLSHLYDGAGNKHIYVPDTNALIYNPQLEDWSFDGVSDFTLVLTPTVLSELDHLKVNHRNEDVRQKAEGLIRRIKGYRTRGRLADGVPLRSGRSLLQTIAVEPNMDESLPWLKADNSDDLVLAAFIEVMREHPRCQVILVTRDINLQNKAEYAALPFAEPPEP